jgi:hypothetical protein
MSFKEKISWIYKYFISYLMVTSVLKKSLPFPNYSKNIERPSKKFLIKMSIFVLQRYLCYKYWAMCYEVVLMCYNRNPFIQINYKLSNLDQF